MHAYRSFLLAILTGFVGTASNATQLSAQEIQPLPPVLSTELAGETGTLGEVESIHRAATSNPMLWQQYQALQMGGSASQSCATCNSGRSGTKRCGCDPNLFPLIDGPGDCDQWCVGPKWDVDAGVLMMFRGNVDWASASNGFVGNTTLEDQFDVGPGGRVFVTGYNDAGYGIQVGYQGINDWDATLSLDNGGDVRDFLYQSRLNSVEINFLTNNPSPWKLFTGFRYVQLDEDFINTTNLEKTIPDPVTTPDPPVAYVDSSASNLLTNRLFGFQIGGRRDSWNIGNRLTFQTYANAGIYWNKFRRDDVVLTLTTIITGDDLDTAEDEFSRTSSTVQTTSRNNLTDLAFVGEAGLSASWRLNQCTAVRLGYQIIALDGVGQALEASLTPALGADMNNSTFFHGLQLGLEYRR